MSGNDVIGENLEAQGEGQDTRPGELLVPE